MKYLNSYEDEFKKLSIFCKDYINTDTDYLNDKFSKIYDDLEELKDLNVDYKLYYYVDEYFGLLFKVYIKDYLTNGEINILKKLKFNEMPINYKFTFKWILTDEKNMDVIISSYKYNL